VDFVSAQSCCPHALADGTQRIQIRKKTLEFFSTVLCTGGIVLLASVYLINGNLTLLDHLALMRWPEASDVPDAAEISFTSQWTEY